MFFVSAPTAFGRRRSAACPERSRRVGRPQLGYHPESEVVTPWGTIDQITKQIGMFQKDVDGFLADGG